MRKTIGLFRMMILFYYYNMKLILREVRDCFILFLIVFTVLGTPVWLGYTLYFIFKWAWSLTMATSYLVFWNIVPCTPYIGICIAITLFLRKIFK